MVDPGNPFVAPIALALYEHRGGPIAAVEIGYQDWNDTCRALGRNSGDHELRFQGAVLRMGSHEHGVRLIPV